MEGMGLSMTERTSCCDDIVETMGRVKSIEDWRDEYIISAQRWRDHHEAKNRDEMKAIADKLDRIETKITTFVNPIVSVILSVLTGIIGILAGALYVLAR